MPLVRSKNLSLPLLCISMQHNVQCVVCTTSLKLAKEMSGRFWVLDSFTHTTHTVTTQSWLKIGKVSLELFCQLTWCAEPNCTWQWRSAAGCRRGEAPWGGRVPSAEGHTCLSCCYWSHRAPPGCWSCPLIGWLQGGSPAYWPTHSGIASCDEIPTKKTKWVLEQRTWQEIKLKDEKGKIERRIHAESEHIGTLRVCAPLCFNEQVVWELRQMVVLEVQDLQLWSLQPLSQLTHLVPACQKFSQAPTGHQPTTHKQ